MNNIPKGICGIYEISCAANGKRYIGSSQRCRIRIGNHFGGLARNSHYNRHLQSAWNKHGKHTLAPLPFIAYLPTDEGTKL
jgi:predicted GIY-YIG superfamily endonuclease